MCLHYTSFGISYTIEICSCGSCAESQAKCSYLPIYGIHLSTVPCCCVCHGETQRSHAVSPHSEDRITSLRPLGTYREICLVYCLPGTSCRLIIVRTRYQVMKCKIIAAIDCHIGCTSKLKYSLQQQCPA